MRGMNIFRIAGDLSHLSAKCILIYAIHRNRSAEGVSLITQVLYTIVFLTRYICTFTNQSTWNLLFKIIYFATSFYTMGVMQWVFPRSREREISWKLGAIILAGSLVLTPFDAWIFPNDLHGVPMLLDIYSKILESVCILPQLLLLRQTTIPTVIDSFYLLALGSYRALYLVNWIVRETESNDLKPDTTSVVFGVIQTIIYLEFAWIYYSRQRLKLRNGGIVDSDDLRRGWLLSRILGNKHMDAADEDEESGLAGGDDSRRPAGRPKWGSRGISVSADDGILETDRANREVDEELDRGVDPDAREQDADDLARVLDDDDDDEDDDDEPLPSAHGDRNGALGGVKSGQEWRD